MKDVKDMRDAKDAKDPAAVRVLELGGGAVWLRHRDGEAGTFRADEVEPVRHDAARLEAFFWRNF